jgi:2-iminobutanoate/2-iminopropanoate deaminase
MHSFYKKILVPFLQGIAGKWENTIQDENYRMEDGAVREIIHTASAPAAVGPYSQGVKVGNLVFISGQLGLDTKTGEIRYDSVEIQTRQVLENLKAIAEASGSSLKQAVKVTVYLTDMGNFDLVNKIYAQYFPENPPARVCVEVNRLPKDVAVEMDAICVLTK